MYDGQFTIKLYGTNVYTEPDSNSEVAKTSIADVNTIVTFTNATNLINFAGNTLNNNDIIYFTTTGVLPTGINADTNYYVINSATNSFQISATLGGSAVAFTDDGTPTNTVHSNSETNDIELKTYTIYPFYSEKINRRQSGGGYQVESTTQYNSYDIHFARFKNNYDDYSDMTILDNLYNIFNKKYKYIEFVDYWRIIQTSGKLTNIVIPERKIDKELSGMVDVTIHCEKVKPK